MPSIIQSCSLLGYQLKYIRYCWSPLVYVPVNNWGRTCDYHLPGLLFHLWLHLVLGISPRFDITKYQDNSYCSHHEVQFTLEQCKHVIYYRQLPRQQFPPWISFCAQCVQTSTAIHIIVMAFFTLHPLLPVLKLWLPITSVT